MACREPCSGEKTPVSAWVLPSVRAILTTSQGPQLHPCAQTRPQESVVSWVTPGVTSSLQQAIG